jgi:hypothetical protein
MKGNGGEGVGSSAGGSTLYKGPEVEAPEAAEVAGSWIMRQEW